jgi:hypothetical protein
MTAWDDKDFGSSKNPKANAVPSNDVGWMLVEWTIRRDDKKCKDCGGNYTLHPDQFEDLPVGVTLKQATKILRKYVKNRRENVSDRPDDPVRDTIFLVKVVKVANITDDRRNLLPDVEIDVDD